MIEILGLSTYEEANMIMLFIAKIFVCFAIAYVTCGVICQIVKKIVKRYKDKRSAKALKEVEHQRKRRCRSQLAVEQAQWDETLESVGVKL